MQQIWRVLSRTPARTRKAKISLATADASEQEACGLPFKFYFLYDLQHTFHRSETLIDAPTAHDILLKRPIPVGIFSFTNLF